MARPHGHARVSTRNPEAFAVCQRCGFWYNLVDLRWQYYFNGPQLFNSRLLVCKKCDDKPNEQLKTIILPPDPVAVQNARTEPFSYDEAGPTQSLIAQNANQGDTVIYLNSVSGFVAGNNVLVQMNNGNFAEENILSVDPVANTITVSIPLPYSASINGVVTVTAT